MAALMPPPLPSASVADGVRGQLAKAAGKIRLHDLTVGGLLVAVTLLAYVAAMVLFDKWLALDATIRQAAWFSLVALLGVIAYRYLFKPLRNAVNPLYTAKLVEETVPDAKNSLVNWVDLQDAPIPASVRDAVSAKAAKQLAGADVNKALESRSLIYSGAAVAALIVLLAVLFLVFKPAVFGSLVGRALNPFSTGAIATRTSITLLQPAGGDLTITAGEPVTIAVSVVGREPDVSAPDRLRVLLRHNPAEPVFEEVPLEPQGNREWSVRVPHNLIQNGFWYRVAGGDDETAEHKVTVRPRPIFTNFSIQYKYPAYLNLKDETGRDPHIEAFRGTEITITATANRDLKDGRMVVQDVPQPVVGEVAGNSLKVRFTLMENGTYRLFFTSTSGESNADSPPFLLRILTDAAPVVQFKPTQVESNDLPLNGLLTVDGDAADDFGVDRMALKLRVENGPLLQGKPYRNGQSFRREKDNTWSTAVEYKDSVRIDQLKLENGAPANLKEGTVVEYWLEAADNCTVPKANVGVSRVYKIRLIAAKTDPEEKKDQQEKADQRGAEEKDNQQKQDTKNAGEKRDPKAGPQEKKNPDQPQPEKPDQNPQPGDKTDPKNDKNNSTDPKPQPGDKADPKNDKNNPTDPKPQPGDKTDPKNDKNNPTEPKPQPGDKTDPKNDKNNPTEPKPQPGDKTDPKNDKNNPTEPKPQPGDKTDPKNDKNNPTEPKPQPGDKTDPKNDKNNSTDPKPQPGDKTDPKNDKNNSTDPKPQPGDNDLKNKAEELQKKIDEMNKEAGQPKPGETSQPNEPPTPSTEPKPNKPEAGQPPAESKPEPKDSKGGEASQEKSEGAKPQPANKSESKPDEKNQGGSAAEEKPSKTEPSKPGGQEKPAPGEPKSPQEQPGDARNNEKPKPGEPAKGAEAKGGGEQKPAEEKAAPKPGDHKPDETGDAKNQTPPQAAERKPGEPDKTKPEPKDADPKANESASAEKSEGQPPKTGDPKTDPKSAKGTEKPLPSDDKTAKKDPPKAGGENKPLDPKDLTSKEPGKADAAKKELDRMNQEAAKKEAEQLVKDLQSKDEATRKAAEKKLDDIKKELEKQANSGTGDKPPDPKDLENAAKDLNSKDDAKRGAAEKKFDEAMMNQAKKQAEQLAKDLQSDDPATKAAAEKKFDDLMKQAEQMAGKKQPTKDQMDQIKEMAKDLKSPDKDTREKAEKALDNMMGKENRDKIQDDLKNSKPEEPLPPEIQKKIEDMAKEGKIANLPRPGGAPPGGPEEKAKPIAADKDFAKRAGQMQLDTFKKERANKELLKKLNWNQEDYDNFVKGFEEMLNRPETTAKAPEPGPAPVGKVNTSGANRVETRTGPAAGSPQAAGAANAPPGYGDALRKFLKDSQKPPEKK